MLESQLERLVGARRGTLKRRLSTLVTSGYLRSGSVFGDTHYQIGSEGLTAVGSSLKRPRLRLPNYRHDVGVAWLWLAARGGTFGPLRLVLAERSLRSHDGAVDRPFEPYGVRTGEIDRHGNERLHYPDLLLIDREWPEAGARLELTPKGRQRIERILEAVTAPTRGSTASSTSSKPTPAVGGSGARCSEPCGRWDSRSTSVSSSSGRFRLRAGES